MREIPFNNVKVLFFFIVISTGLACLIDDHFGNRIDYWVHDNATVYQAREKWTYSAIVALDDGIPLSVGRKQALPLFARATDRLIASGVKGVFLDARIPKQLESQMPYAECIQEDGRVQWSVPECNITSRNQCVLTNSTLGIAPLAMSDAAISHFLIAPYMDAEQGLPDFLLYGWSTAALMPKAGITADDYLATKNSAIARWFPLDKNHAIYRLAQRLVGDKIHSFIDNPANEVCDNNRLCRRIRQSRPLYQLSSVEDGRPIFPLSTLASCNTHKALQAASLLKNRIVILQTTAVNESTDVIITPFASAIFAPNLVTPGAQFIADSLETLLNLDHPAAPPRIVKILLFLLAALLGVILSCYFKTVYLLIGGGLFFLGLIALCLFNHQLQLWPVTASMTAFISGGMEGIGTLLLLANKEGKLINQYMPRQIREILLKLAVDKDFQSRRCNAIVLMSDLKGYTTLTQLLNEPALILNLMNDYLSETSVVLQEKYNGWLESYVGDMVCYYWPCLKDSAIQTQIDDALYGALELSELQKQFFTSIHRRYQHQLTTDTLKKIDDILNAGIGISCGEVIMGDLGPKNGTRKFGIIGNPLNIAARIESLTRQFNTHIIVTETCLQHARSSTFSTRFLGTFQVKGALTAEALYALGRPEDPRFAPDLVLHWQCWVNNLLSGKTAETQPCPAIFEQDKQTLLQWKQRGLLKNGVFLLDEK